MDIGNRNIRIEPSEFKGKIYVSIREWYQPDKEGQPDKFLPGKKGISLNMEEWQVIVDNFDEIKAEIELATNER
jgi:hypothetical protein